MTANKENLSDKIIDEQEINLVVLFKYLWIEKKKIIYITSFFFIVSIIYAFLATPWYEAKVKILPANENNTGLSGFVGIAAMAGIDLNNLNENKQEIYPEIIKSNFILIRVLNTKFKNKTYTYPIDLFQFFEIKFDSSEEGWKSKIYNKMEDYLRENIIHTTIDKINNILTLSIKIPNDPILAAELANFIVAQLDYYNQNIKKNKAKDKRIFIENSLDETQDKLYRAQAAVKMFKEENKIINSPEQQLLLERLNIDVDVQKTIFIELKRQLEIAKIEEIRETETIEILEDANIPINPIWPRKKMIATSGIILGFCFSLFILFIFRFLKVLKSY
ncbi:MAG: hypothetical protein JW956_05425 [Calditrichaceae bacterium]|nr:hypothetical protein [Calditrichaceae bacterium]